MYIVLAFLLLAILIVMHELGHFMAARLMKIDVREFSVGFGPRLLGRKSKKHGTDFSLRLIPLGGFCAFYGEDDTTGESKDDPRAFAKHNVWKRMFVILMGPVMNFVLAFMVAVAFFWIFGQEVPTEKREYDPCISSVEAGPAQDAGMKAGDVIVRINGQDMLLDADMEPFMSTVAGWKEGDEPLQITVRRGNETLEMSMTPVWDEENGRMRINVGLYPAIRTEIQPVGFLEGFGCAAEYCVFYGGTIIRGLGDLVSGKGWENAAGPVGIVSGISGQVAQTVEQGGARAGANVFTQLLIIISINLGLMNLLPIPGLDGSRLVFGIVEAIRRKPVPPEKEAIVHLVGIALLLGLMLVLTFQDVSRLINQQ